MHSPTSQARCSASVKDIVVLLVALCLIIIASGYTYHAVNYFPYESVLVDEPDLTTTERLGSNTVVRPSRDIDAEGRLKTSRLQSSRQRVISKRLALANHRDDIFPSDAARSLGVGVGEITRTRAWVGSNRDGVLHDLRKTFSGGSAQSSTRGAQDGSVNSNNNAVGLFLGDDVAKRRHDRIVEALQRVQNVAAKAAVAAESIVPVRTVQGGAVPSPLDDVVVELKTLESALSVDQQALLLELEDLEKKAQLLSFGAEGEDLDDGTGETSVVTTRSDVQGEAPLADIRLMATGSVLPTTLTGAALTTPTTKSTVNDATSTIGTMSADSTLAATPATNIVTGRGEPDRISQSELRMRIEDRVVKRRGVRLQRAVESANRKEEERLAAERAAAAARQQAQEDADRELREEVERAQAEREAAAGDHVHGDHNHGDDETSAMDINSVPLVDTHHIHLLKDGKKPDICIVTLYDTLTAKPGAIGGRYLDLIGKSMENKRAYAKRNGYDFHIDLHMWKDKNRPVAWSKLLAIRERLNEYKWVMWVDVDTLYLNWDIKLESLIDENYDLVVTKDKAALNSGVMLLKSSDWSKNMLESAYAKDKFLKHLDIYEQRAIIETLKEDRQASRHVKYIPQKAMNSYTKFHSGHAQYSKGDFMVHFAGCRHLPGCNSAMGNLFTNFYNQALRDNKGETKGVVPQPPPLAPTRPANDDNKPQLLTPRARRRQRQQVAREAARQQQQMEQERLQQFQQQQQQQQQLQQQQEAQPPQQQQQEQEQQHLPWQQQQEQQQQQQQLSERDARQPRRSSPWQTKMREHLLSKMKENE